MTDPTASSDDMKTAGTDMEVPLSRLGSRQSRARSRSPAYSGEAASSEQSEAEVENTQPSRSAHDPPSRKAQALVLISGFLTIFETIGINQTYGVFQQYYTSTENDMLPASVRSQRALLAFVGTLGAGLTWGGSVYVNPLIARVKDPRWITVAGSIMMSLGLILAGFSTQLSHLYATQGLLYGIGTSLLYFPIISSAPEWFDGHRGAAMGFILSGAGLGGLCYSPIARTLLSNVGPRWTLRILGFITLAITLPVAMTVRFRYGPPATTRMDLRIARRPVFYLQSLAALLQSAGNFVPMTFLNSFSTSLGFTASFAAVLLAINNGVNTSSRILMGAAADYVGRQNMIIVGMLGSALAVWLFWMLAVVMETGGQTIWIAFVVIYGLVAGAYNALLPTVIAEVYGMQNYASVNGFTYFVRGIGAFFGSPVAGVILDANSKPSQIWEGYRKVVIYDGTMLTVATICVVLVRFYDAVDKAQWRWKA